MKKIIYILLFVLTVSSFSHSQVIYSSKIDSVINLVSDQTISKYVRDLSGDTIATIGGLPYDLISRLWSSEGNTKAAQYIYETFQSFGLQTRYQVNNATNVNVIARKTGSVYPELKVVIGAHYDDMRGNATATDTIPGADDNASGVAAVLEAARLLANYNPKFTIEFVVFDEEEIGLYGAGAYADSCLADSSEALVGVLNMDMIAWDGNNDAHIRIKTHQFCDIIADMLICTYQRYSINLIPIKEFNGGGSDHVAFWMRGYGAITSIEPGYDFNPYYHSMGDVFSIINMDYFRNNVKANLAALMSVADQLFYLIDHNPIQSSSDTAQRIAEAEMIYPIPLGTGANAPRLYYKINNGQYQYVNAFDTTGGIHRFQIPGQPNGTQVSYYIAAQDSSGVYVSTSPAGGSGANPPGTTPPQQVHVYNVLTSLTRSSSNQKPILDFQYTYDTIYIPEAGNVVDIKVNLNINHPNDGEIFISLRKESDMSSLSQFNGEGGQNFTNTTFHDTASVPITQGNPPFTGYFRPQSPLYNFNGDQVQGNWILRIFDNRAGNTGTLLNWTLDIKYSSSVSIKKIENTFADKYILYQNYPNPFNPTTTIKYSIPKNGDVYLKIYDVLGKEVAVLVNEWHSAGTYSVTWDASVMPSGIYFYRLSSEGYTETKRMVLVK
ncbi:M20/M25/M40 family metallo-hydrolase [Bacteroidota bacterium]